MSDPSSSPSSPLKPFLSLFGLGKSGEEPAAAAPAEGAVDIVDQAEAFQTLKVEDVMIPRVDIVAVEVSSPLDEVVRRFVDAEHSRMPVYRETLDDPLGLVHIKDVMKLLAPEADGRGPNWGEPVLHRLKREVLYVPASMRAADLLVKMQSERAHMALVIDEFGGTDGLVTLEDLIEAVVGDIEDEHDEAAAVGVVLRPGGVIEADARAPLEELEALAGAALAPADYEEEIDTVAGLVSALAGRVPQRGEVISHPGGWDFEVIDADPRKIKRVRMRRTERTAAGSEGPRTEGARP
jgi:CBS domain containing-hemolysin-like protein